MPATLDDILSLTRDTNAKVSEMHALKSQDLDNWEAALSVLNDIKALLIKALQESGDGELAKVMGEIAAQLAEVVGELKEVHGLQVALPGEVSERVTTGVESAILSAEAMALGDGVDVSQRN